MIKVKVLNKGCTPYKKHKTDAGLDLRANLEYPLDMVSGGHYRIDTGIQVAIPEGYCGLVFPRSGLGTKIKLKLDNTIGVIDSDYRGNIMVFVSPKYSYTLEPFERFAQLVVVPILCDLTFVKELDDTDRGTGGFGSTGDK